MGGLRQRIFAVLLLAVWAAPTTSFALIGLHVLLGTHQSHHSATGHSHGHGHHSHAHHQATQGRLIAEPEVQDGVAREHEAHRHDHPGHSHSPEGHVHDSASSSHGRDHQHPSDGAEVTDCHAEDHDLSVLAEALAHGHHHPSGEAVPEHEERLIKTSRVLAFSGPLLTAPLPVTDRTLGPLERDRCTSDSTGREPAVPLFTVKCALLL